MLELPARIDPLDWPELSYAHRLTDGLPTFPPERAAVEALVRDARLDPDAVVGAIPPSGRVATVRDVAANAVMAGCLPAHLLVVLRALEAMGEPRFNLAGVVTTTHPCWPLVIVSGTAVAHLGMATAESVFNGGGARANLAIGRAVRLVIWNVGAAYPRAPVQEIFGHPGRLAFCVAESPDSPWPPFHAARGLPDADAAVTVFACEAPQMANLWGLSTSDNPDVGAQWLDLVADQMRGRGSNNTHTMGEILVALSPSMARVLAERGYTREDVQDHLWQRARRRLGDIRLTTGGAAAVDAASAYEWWPDWVDQTDPDTMVPVATDPASIHVLVTGADSIPGAAVLPGWGHLGGFAVTRPLDLPEKEPQ